MRLRYLSFDRKQDFRSLRTIERMDAKGMPKVIPNDLKFEPRAFRRFHYLNCSGAFENIDLRISVRSAKRLLESQRLGPRITFWAPA